MSTTLLPQERRRNSRIPLLISVRERSASGVVMCVATDISESGMALKRASDSTAPTPVILEFSLPGIEGLVRVTARFIRQIQTASVQLGAVKFDSVPESLNGWLAQCGHSPMT
ncbi:PilZ domain-containing protein [Myxococcota bacterium]|nr:PilZ domain-containing protein [Myxococcota bacterium]